MDQQVLLYFDLLGARARWREGGAVAAKDAFDSFASLMIWAAKPFAADVQIGATETDAAAFVCATTSVALRIARKAFVAAFLRGPTAAGPRTWLRGSLVPWHGSELRQVRSSTVEAIKIWTFSPSLLDAVAIEKSGFKGMRLLMRSGLVTPALRREFRLQEHHQSIIPFRRLKHSGYPQVADGDLLDFMWMMSNDSEERSTLNYRMALRLRESTSDPEEFAQAAATQVVFHEAAAIHASVAHRAKVLAGK